MNLVPRTQDLSLSSYRVAAYIEHLKLGSEVLGASHLHLPIASRLISVLVLPVFLAFDTLYQGAKALKQGTIAVLTLSEWHAVEAKKAFRLFSISLFAFAISPLGVIKSEIASSMILDAVAQDKILPNDYFKARKRPLGHFEGLDVSLENHWNTTHLDSNYNEIVKAFRAIEFSRSSTHFVHKCDLMDALDLMHSKDPGRFPLIEVHVPEKPARKMRGGIPLVPLHHLKKFSEQKITALSVDELIEKLGDNGEVEHSNVARLIHWMTASDKIQGRCVQFIYRALTAMAGKKYSQKVSTKNLAEMSLSVHIDPIEIFTAKTESSTSFRYYRGPKHLFNTSIHSYQAGGLSFNHWFKRLPTVQALTEYLQAYRWKKSKLEAKYGDLGTLSPFVIATGDSRCVIAVLEAGDLGDRQHLRGKVLNAEAAEEARLQGENPRYYSSDLLSWFSVKNLFGREHTDEMKPTLLGVSQDKIPSEKLIHRGYHQLLGAMYRLLDRKGVVQVVQRLAPQDIHHYFNTLDGRALTPQAAAQKLETLLENNSDPVERASLVELASLFKKQEEASAKSPQVTIDIHGENASVSTTAIWNRPATLSLNDRKILLFEHLDGSVSVHAYIGATGVNDVGVVQANTAAKIGDDRGFMGFGNDGNHSKLKLMRTGEEKIGSEEINGSTVISYYLKSDFIPRADFLNLKQNVALEKNGESIEIEAKVKMGTPLLVRTEIAIAECLFRHFPEELKGDVSLDSLTSLLGRSLRKETPKQRRLLSQDELAMQALNMLPEGRFNKVLGLVKQRASVE